MRIGVGHDGCMADRAGAGPCVGDFVGLQIVVDRGDAHSQPSGDLRGSEAARVQTGHISSAPDIWPTTAVWSTHVWSSCQCKFLLLYWVLPAAQAQRFSGGDHKKTKPAESGGLCICIVPRNAAPIGFLLPSVRFHRQRRLRVHTPSVAAVADEAVQ